MSKIKQTFVLESAGQYLKWKKIMSNYFQSKSTTRSIFLQLVEVPTDDALTPEQEEIVQNEHSMISDLMRS
jgi:hypothetical protein